MKLSRRAVILGSLSLLAERFIGRVARADSTTQESVLSDAVDAYIYGYPLVVTEMTRRVLTNVRVPGPQSAPMGQFAHYRTFPTPTTQDIAGSNVDTLYSIAWLDLSKGRYVLRLPDEGDRFYLMPILDAWSEVIGSPGTRTTGNSAGEFALTGPQWSGALPAGVREIRSKTNLVWIAGRTYTTGTPEDYDAVHAIQDQYSLVPLAKFGQPYSPPEGTVDPNIDMKTPPRDQVDRMDAGSFFKLLASLMRENPAYPEDAPMVAKLGRLGIVGDFDISKVSADLAQALSRAPAAALEKTLAHYNNAGRIVNGWFLSAGSGHYGTDYLQRALVAYIGLGGNLPADAYYPIAQVDDQGKPLTGAHNYVMHFEKGDAPPVNAFWSITMYNKGYFMVQNAINRYSLSGRDPLKYNKDGSLDLYIQKASPETSKVSNWLPAPEGDFLLMLRLYWPKDTPPSILDGTWTPPPVRRF